MQEQNVQKKTKWYLTSGLQFWSTCTVAIAACLCDILATYEIIIAALTFLFAISILVAFKVKRVKTKLQSKIKIPIIQFTFLFLSVGNLFAVVIIWIALINRPKKLQDIFNVVHATVAIAVCVGFNVYFFVQKPKKMQPVVIDEIVTPEKSPKQTPSLRNRSHNINF